MSQSDLPIIQSLWIGGQLSVMEQLSIRSFVANGHTYHLYTYGDVKGIPDGVVVKDGNEILPADRIFVYKKEKSYAGFANLFRYKLLLDRGGFWVDTDIICLKPYRFNQDFLIGRVSFSESEWIYGPEIIKTQPGSVFARRCFEEASIPDPQSLVWGQKGPDLTTKMVEELGMHDLSMPEYYFGCIRSKKYYRSIHPKPHYSFAFWYLFQLKGAYSLHLYNEMWRRHKIDKNAVFPAHTIYERLKRRYSLSLEDT